MLVFFEFMIDLLIPASGWRWLLPTLLQWPYLYEKQQRNLLIYNVLEFSSGVMASLRGIHRMFSFGDNIPACLRSGIPTPVTIGNPDQLGVFCVAIRPDPVTRASYEHQNQD